jgi:hypothetical protein
MGKLKWIFILVLFLAACIVRISYNDNLFAFDLKTANYDGVDYHWLAKNLCRLRGYHTFFGTGHDYHLLRSPGYPLYIALVYCLGGMHFWTLRIVDTVLSSLSVLVVCLIARNLAGRKAGAIAAALAVFYRPAIYYATRIFSENLFCLLLLALVYLMSFYRDRKWALMLGGGISGYMILTRPAWISVVPFILAWILLSCYRRKTAFVCFILAQVIVLLPWIIYCAMSLGMPPSPVIFSSSLGAENTWAAHNPRIGDFTQLGASPGRLLEHEWSQLALRRFRDYELSETEYIRRLNREARQFFRRDPLRCLRLGAKRVYRAWLGSGIMDGQGTILPDTGQNPYGVIYWKQRIFNPEAYVGDSEVVEQLMFNRTIRIAGIRIPLISFEGIFYVLVLGLIWCALVNIRHPLKRFAEVISQSALLLLIVLGYGLTNIFGITIQRYRFPLDYVLIIFSGIALSCAVEPLFRFIRVILARLGVSIPDGEIASSSVHSCRGGGRLAKRLLLAIVVIVLVGRIAQNLYGFRSQLREHCAIKLSDEDILSHMGYNEREVPPGPDYKTAWRRQMEGMGDLGELLGREILLRGEVTWINLPSPDEFNGEVYLAEARQRFGTQIQDPIYCMLIVDSYKSMDSIGSGKIIVVAPRSMLQPLKDGDSVAVMGRIGGTDYIVGSMILCAERIVSL